MRQYILAALMIVPGASMAQDGPWVPLSGPEISVALTAKTVTYGEKWQDFRASGRTLYFAGRESWGYWAVRDDQYCSTWPPSDLWDCYDMTTNGTQVQFIGRSGDITVGTFKTDAD